MKRVAGQLRLELAQYNELQAFSQFASDLDKATQAQLARGKRLQEILKQPQYSPLKVYEQVAIIYAASNGFLDDVEVKHVTQFKKEFLQYVNQNAKGYVEIVEAGQDLKGTDAPKILEKALNDFKKGFKAA